MSHSNSLSVSESTSAASIDSLIAAMLALLTVPAVVFAGDLLNWGRSPLCVVLAFVPSGDLLNRGRELLCVILNSLKLEVIEGKVPKERRSMEPPISVLAEVLTLLLLRSNFGIDLSEFVTA